MVKDKTTEKIDWLINQVLILSKQISREKNRVNRLVQVLRNNLPKENLNKVVHFEGIDCHDNLRYEYMTLDTFLSDVIDP